MNKTFILILTVIAQYSQTFCQAPLETPSTTLKPPYIFGKLNNGLTYYISKNSIPKNKIHLDLIVKTGIYQKEAKDIEVAHFIEHMAFRGTQNFSGDSILNYLTKKGLTNGKDIQATTSGNYTTYSIVIPTGEQDLLINSLKIIRDWATSMNFPDDAIEAEREVILSEKRQGGEGNFPNYIFEKLSSILYGSPKLKDLRERSIKNVTTIDRIGLVKFYNTWYVPTLQAIIVTGEIDPKRIERNIYDLFSEVPQGKGTRVNYSFTELNGKLFNKLRVISLKYKEGARYNFEIFFKQRTKSAVYNSKARIREQLMENLGTYIINSILSQDPQYLTNNANAGFYFQRNFYNSKIDVMSAYLSVDTESNVKEELKGFYEKLYRIINSEISSEDYQEYKNRLLSEIQDTKQESTKEISMRFVDNFINGSRITTIEQESNERKQILKTIELQSLRIYLRSWLNSRNIDFVITSPEKEIELTAYDAEKIISQTSKKLHNLRTTETNNIEITDALDFFKTKDVNQQHSVIVTNAESTKDESATVELPDQNIKVFICKNSQLSVSNQGKIVFFATRNGGLSKFDSSDASIARLVPEVISFTGPNWSKRFQFVKFLKSKDVNIKLSLDDLSEQIRANSPVNNIETLFQSISLYLSSFQIDSSSLHEWKQYKQNQLKLQNINPNLKLEEEIRLSQTGIKTKTPEEIDEITLNKINELYSKQFKGFNNSTIYISGNLQVNEVIGFVKKYFATLPIDSLKHIGQPSNKTPKRRKVEKTIFAGDGEQAHVKIFFPIYISSPSTPKSDLMFQIIGKVLNNMIFESVRIKEGFAYSPKAFLWRTTTTDRQVDSVKLNFIIDFTVSTTKVDQSTKLAKNEFLRLKEFGPDSVQAIRAINQLRREILDGETNWRSSQDHDLTACFHAEPIPTAESVLHILEGVSVSELKTFCSYYLTDDFMQTFVLLPENSKQQLYQN